jgi:hypothetical protein
MYSVTYTAPQTTILRSQFPEAKHAKFILSGCGDGIVFESNISGPFGAKVSAFVSNIYLYTGNLQINVGQVAGNASDVRINSYGNLPHERIIVAGGSGTQSGSVSSDINGNTYQDGGYLSYFGNPINDDTQFYAYNLLSYSGLYSEGLSSLFLFFSNKDGESGTYDEFQGMPFFGGGRGGDGYSGSLIPGLGGGGGGGATDDPELPGGAGGIGGSIGPNFIDGENGGTFFNANTLVTCFGGTGGLGGGDILSGGMGGSYYDINLPGKGGDGWCGGGGAGTGGQDVNGYATGGSGMNGGGSSFVVTAYQTDTTTNPFTTSEITFERGNYQTMGYVTIIWYLIDITSPEVWNTYVGNLFAFNYKLTKDIIFNNNFGGNITLQANCIFNGQRNTIYLKNVNNFTGLFNLKNADNTTLIKDLTLYCFNTNLLDNNSFFSEGLINGNCIIDNCKIILKNTTMGNNCGGFTTQGSQNITINNSFIRGRITGTNSGGIAGNNIANLNINNCRVIGVVSNDSGRLVGNNSTINNINDTYSVGYGPNNLVLNNTIINNSENIYFANIRIL